MSFLFPFFRFLRDGYHTELEDASRQYYKEHETSRFQNIECQFPVFFAYIAITGIFSLKFTAKYPGLVFDFCLCVFSSFSWGTEIITFVLAKNQRYAYFERKTLVLSLIFDVVNMF